MLGFVKDAMAMVTLIGSHRRDPYLDGYGQPTSCDLWIEWPPGGPT